MHKGQFAEHHNSAFTSAEKHSAEQVDLPDRLTPGEIGQFLLEQNTTFNSILQIFQGIILILDIDARIVYINPFMEQITGYQKEEVIGKDWFSTFLPPADHDEIRRLFKKAIDTTQTQGNINPILT